MALLLENGANPNGRYFFGSEINLASPLKPEILELLLHFGANVNEQDRNGLTAIMKACRLHQVGIKLYCIKVDRSTENTFLLNRYSFKQTNCTVILEKSLGQIANDCLAVQCTYLLLGSTR